MISVERVTHASTEEEVWVDMEHRIDVRAITGEQALIILLRYYAGGTGLTESAIADELNDLLELTGSPDEYTRDRVHTIHEAAKRRLRRGAEQLECVS